MTREEAIKWVDHRMCFGRGTFTENHPPNIDECWEAGCMAIEALSAERTGWIPVSERLPKVGEYVLASVHDHCADCDVIINKYEEQAFWSNGRITAWQPLPESYKGGEAE